MLITHIDETTKGDFSQVIKLGLFRRAIEIFQIYEYKGHWKHNPRSIDPAYLRSMATVSTSFTLK